MTDDNIIRKSRKTWVLRSDHLHEREGSAKVIKETKHPYVSQPQHGRSLMIQTENPRWSCLEIMLFDLPMDQTTKLSKLKPRGDLGTKFIALRNENCKIGFVFN